jgi:hypothetical protein
MDDSLSRWLALREAVDAKARSDTLARLIADALDIEGSLHAVDLATGTGSNIRYLMPRLPRRQRWLALDRDAQLLAEFPDRMSTWGAAHGYDVQRTVSGCAVRGERLDCRIETRRMDLDRLDDDGIFEGRHLVTASALLDLVSARWLRALATHCRTSGAAALFTMTYNGRSSCSPPEPEDEMIRTLMNRHQKRDKGLGGPAEGPDAADRAAKLFSESGFVVRRESSDWILGRADDDLQRELIDGWARAAAEASPGLSTAIGEWRLRRLQCVNTGQSRVVVSHDDLAALRPG